MNQVFDTLKAIMAVYGKSLNVIHDKPDNYYVDTFHVQKNKKNLWFGGVQIKKNYVSYHLMPVYVNPSLLDDISPELARRMQGKSCFNFKTEDKKLFKELAQLTKLAFKDYASKGYIES